MSIRSQRQAILNVLLDAHGEEVPSYVLAQCSLQYKNRIIELRRLGFRIESRIKHVNGETHGFYRLESGTAALRLKIECDSVGPDPQLSLFDAVGGR